MQSISAPPGEPLSGPTNPGLTRWQNITLVTLLIGYAGYYICRSNFSVVAKPIGEEFHLDKEALGNIASWGVVFYAIGKLFGGLVCDFLGGRAVFLFGMLGSVACTILFAVGPQVFGVESAATVFLVAWSLNRLIQSAGWGALVKVASRWYPVARHGRIMGILCLSYLFGDAAARLFLGQLLRWGFDWRQLFFAAAGTLSAIGAVCYLTLKSSPTAVGLPEPQANPENVFGAKGFESRPADLVDLLAPLLSSPTFWLVCVISMGLTFIREALNFWIPTYLMETAGLSDDRAATFSALFPFIGGISALAAGRLTDYWSNSSRGKVIVPALVILVVALLALGSLPEKGTIVAPLVCVAAVAFLLIGPYTFLTGVMALDFGGKRGSSTAAGLVDCAGYIGSIVSLRLIGFIADRHGWKSVFMMLAAVAALSALAAVLYWLLDEMRRQAIRRTGAIETDIATMAPSKLAKAGQA